MAKDKVNTNEAPKDDKAYIECACHDLNHLSRLWFNDEDGTFYLEYKLMRFPGEVPTVSSDEGAMEFRSFYRNAFRYIKNIWWAIKGRPLWFDGQAEWERDQALKVSAFINDNLKDWDSDRALEKINARRSKS